jgi:hemerythrin-like metal-binding protein
MNDLHSDVLTGQSKDALVRILDNLVAYTKGHFTSEELLLQTSGYPDLAAHKAEHERFTAQVAKVPTGLSGGQGPYVNGGAKLPEAVAAKSNSGIRSEILGLPE